jgi:hypothetical protein
MVEFVDQNGNFFCRVSDAAMYFIERLARKGFDVLVNDLAADETGRGTLRRGLPWSVRAVSRDGQHLVLHVHFSITELYKRRRLPLFIVDSGDGQREVLLNDVDAIEGM